MTSKRKLSTTSLKKIALTSYFSLLIFMPLWLIVLNPSQGLSPALSFCMFTIPLLFPMKGLLKGNPYTFAWTNFILMIYFLHSLTTFVVSTEDRLWAIIEFSLTCIMFFSASYYAKYRGQELGLSIRKKKEE